jgi:hypothetical protein
MSATTAATAMLCGQLPGALTDPASSAEFDAAPVLAFLAAAARGRGGVLSVPVAWNCLAFGYDLSAGRYTSNLIESASLPVLSAGATTTPLPTGALVALTTGAGPVPAEVVHREGAHPAIAADGTCPAWLSGAPAGAPAPAGGTFDEPTASPDAADGGVHLQELLVLDAYALGAGQPERLRRLQGKWLDELGHCQVSTHYRNAGLADLPETRQYAAYLVEHRSDVAIAVLERSGARPAGDEWMVGELIERLQTSLLYVDELLTVAGLTRWRDQAISPEVFAAQLDDDARDDLRRTVLSWGRRTAPRPGRYASAAAAPVHVALGVHLRASYRDSAPEKVAGRAYPALLAAASGVLTEHLESSGRAVTVDGRRIHVRLDDAWQGGGVWRTEIVASDAALDEVDIPLSLGWFTNTAKASAAPERQSSPPAAPEPTDTPPVDTPPVDLPHIDTPPEDTAPEQPAPGAEPEPVSTRSDATTCMWTFALTSSHQQRGSIPLTKIVADRMDDAGLSQAGVRIVLSHPGTDIAPELLRQNATMNGRRLDGLSWPLEMFVGLRLTASWIVDGSVISVHSTPLDEPKICDGIPLDYDFDEEVVLRSWGTPLDLDLDLDELDTITAAQVLQLLRRHALRVDGSRPLTLVSALPVLHAQAVKAGLQCTLEQVAAAVDGLTMRSALAGSVLVQWARWTDASADGQNYRRPRSTGSRAGVALEDLAVLLSLAVKPSGAPSRVPPVPQQAQVAGSMRRGHLRWIGAAVSPERQAMAREHARELGYDPDTIHPYQTYVRSTRVKAYRRGL